MSESNESREALAVLAADALIEDTLEADLLLRYAREPEGLESAERERVERYLAASPAHRQQLRSLVRFAEAREALVGASGAEPQGRSEEVGSEASPAEGQGARVIEIGSHPRWRNRAVLIGAALAASVLVAVLYGTDGGVGIEPRPSDQLAVEEPEGARSGPDSIQTVPSPDALPEGSPDGRDSQLAEGGSEGGGSLAPPKRPAPSPTPAPVVAEDAPLEAEELLADAPPSGSPPLIPSAEPNPLPIPTPGQPPMPAPRGDEHAAPEPMLLAMNLSGPLDYARPRDAIGLERLAGLRSAGSELPGLQALVPDHVGRTVSASPSLYWYLSADTGQTVEFILNDQAAVDPLLVLRVEGPLQAGIREVDLAAHGVELAPGKEYRWFVSLSDGDRPRAVEVTSRGGVMRVEPDAELLLELEESALADRGRIYASHGLWYDALDLVSSGVARAPEDTGLRELRAGMLEGAGLREIAEFDRRRAPK